MECSNIHRLTPHCQVWHTHAHTHTKVLSHPHTLTYTAICPCTRSRGHVHTQNTKTLFAIVLVKGFNHNAPAPVINPPPTPEEMSGSTCPEQAPRLEGQGVHICQGGPGYQSSPVWLLGKQVQGVQGEDGVREKEVGGEGGASQEIRPALAAKSSWTSQMTIGQRAAVGGQEDRRAEDIPHWFHYC